MNAFVITVSLGALMTALPLPGQIQGKPQFDESGKFRSSTFDSTLESSSHTSGQRGEVLTGMARRLRETDLSGLSPANAATLRQTVDRLSGGQSGSSEFCALMARASEKEAGVLLPFAADVLFVEADSTACLRSPLQRHARAVPKSAYAQYLLGMAWFAGPDPDPAKGEASLRLATSLPAAPAEAWLELGKQYSRNGKDSLAISALEEAVGINPALGQAHYRLAQLFRKAGNGEKADQHLRLWQGLR